MKPAGALILGLCLCAAAARAEAPPAVAGLEFLGDNGRSFSLPGQRLPLRCLDLPGLLALGEAQRAQALDRAAAAGFNAVSFEAPLFGPQGLVPKLGAFDRDAGASFTRALEACDLRRIYAFPVLNPASSVQGLVGAAAPRAAFLAGRNALGWQTWALRQLATLTVKGHPITRSPVVGGWLLYRGPWPGGMPSPGSQAQGADESATAQDLPRLRAWAAWTVKVARKLGYSQELGLGLWGREDLSASAPAPDAPPGAAAGSGPPLAALSEVSFSAQALNEQSQALDVLPPVPGSDAARVDDGALVPAAPANPWDLEGLDWESVDKVLTVLPMASQLNFLEFTLDTEDWYRVGERLAQAADLAEVPVVWRQDWRTASRYERDKRLAPPLPLAGLSGAWPDDDWPAAGESLWPPTGTPGPETTAFAILPPRLLRKGRKLVLELQLTRPASVSVDWGKSVPLDHQARSDGKPKLIHRFTLDGPGPGAWFLLRVRGESERLGACQLRTRWIRAPL
jgi:hypothetical protein